MHVNRRIVDDALYAHFETFSVYRRRRLLGGVAQTLL